MPPFDPDQPATGSPLSSAVVRGNFTGLKDLIDALAVITQAQVDGVVTLDPNDPATAQVSVVGNMLHFTFSIPRGHTGAQGGQGSDGGPGPVGPQGPPFANAVVDGVTTLNPGDSATVTVSFDGSNVRFTFGIPRGAAGADGEVTAAQLTSEIATTALNPGSVSPLGMTADASYNQPQIQQMADKLDELLTALKRP